MKKILLLIIVGCFGIVGCKVKNSGSTTSTNTSPAAVPANSCIDKEYGLVWTKVTPNMMHGIDVNLKGDYLLYTVNNNLLVQTINKAFDKGSDFILTLPVYDNEKARCARFEVQDSQTIARETQKRLGVYSFKAIMIDDELNTVRLDFYQTKGLRAYFQMKEKTLLMEPTVIDGELYYILFDKKNSDAVKQNFEIREKK